MAVQAQEPPRSTPDISKLNGMTSRTLMITQYTSRSTAGRLVLTEQGVSVDRIVKLPNELVRTAGPGTYKFEVADEGGPDKDVWTVKLGPDTPESTGAAYNGAGGGAGFDGAAPGPVYSASIQLAPGWYYNEEFQTLIDPRGNVRRWRPDMGFPPGAQAAAVATPLPSFGGGGAMGFGGPSAPSWGGPAAADPQVEVLKEQLRAEREARREEEYRRSIADLQTGFAKTMEAMTAKMEALAAAAKAPVPTGPSQEVLELKAELARLRDSGESRAREEALRTEMRAAESRTQTLLQELGKDDKNAPMLGLLSTMMTLQQNAAQESARATRETTSAMSESTRNQMTLLAERLSAFSMTPTQMMTMMNSKDTGAQVEFMNSMIGVMRNVLEVQRESAGGSGDMPPWVPVVQQGLDAIGKIGQAMALAQTQRPQQPGARPPGPPRLPAAPQMQRAPGPPMVGMPAAPPARPVAPSATAREQIAQQVFPRGAGAEERDRIAEAAGMPGRPGTAAGPEKPLQRPPRRRPVPIATPAPVAPAIVRAPMAIVPPASELVPMPEPVEITADEVEVQNYTPADLAKMDVDAVRAISLQFSEDDFFGPAAASVVELRDAAAAGTVSPGEIAQAMVQARQLFRGAGEYPPVVELLEANHFVVIVERLLPASGEQFRALVVIELARALSAEAGGAIATA